MTTVTKRSSPEAKKEEKMMKKQDTQQNRQTSTHPPKQTEDATAIQSEARLTVLQSEESNVLNQNWVNSSPKTALASIYLPATSGSPSKPLWNKPALRNPQTKSSQNPGSVRRFSCFQFCECVHCFQEWFFLESIYLHYRWC